MYEYLRLIIELNYPITHIKSPELRQFSRHQDVFSIDYFKEVLFKLIEVVEEGIKGEMRGTKVTIIFDGWTRGSTHYVAIMDFSCEHSFSLRTAKRSSVRKW